MSDKIINTALTIAGSDSGGGAGIQADVKTFSAFGVFGKTIITSITSQNSFGVQSSYDLPTTVIRQQLQAILEDKKCQAVKTGMLGNEEAVLMISRMIKKSRLKKIVIDPVVISSSGKRLLTKNGIEALKEDEILLILGKGHEEFQEIKGTKIPFNDQRVVEEIL